MKTPEELASLRREVEALNTKLSELTDEELAQVAGGVDQHFGLSTTLLKKLPMASIRPSLDERLPV